MLGQPLNESIIISTCLATFVFFCFRLGFLQSLWADQVMARRMAWSNVLGSSVQQFAVWFVMAGTVQAFVFDNARDATLLVYIAELFARDSRCSSSPSHCLLVTVLDMTNSDLGKSPTPGIFHHSFFWVCGHTRRTWTSCNSCAILVNNNDTLRCSAARCWTCLSGQSLQEPGYLVNMLKQSQMQ